ncbi:MAG: PrsW family intramembrane metalloprotease [Bacteroidetes bacterium]|nr:PrsW family intramembrane metalloprotease [Bacteroidota bacterium]
MEIIFSFLPVLLFLFILYRLDSFKLVKVKMLVMCLLWGMLATFLVYYTNNWLREQLGLKFEDFSRYGAPLTEEIFKVALVVYLISRKKIGFSVDAAIYGFAAGAGFSLAENVFYLLVMNTETGMMVWLLRGFGTAMMHGGCTALFAMIIMDGINRNKPLVLAIFPGLIAAFLIHSVFNHFFLNPFLQTALIFIVLPLVFVVVFQRSNSVLQNWLEIEFNSEVEMLRMIRQGKISHTKAGDYLISLKQHFSPEVLVDLHCYFSLYLELSIKAKRNLMLKENGFPLIEEADIMEKLLEIKMLRKQVGKLGELALQPLVRMNHRELWKLNLLKS